MRRGRSRPRTTATTVSIPVSSLSTGAQSANAFSGWTSPATEVNTSGSWGGAAGTKYLRVTNSSIYAAKTKGLSRDQEITFFAEKCYVYLRLTESGKAFRFRFSTETNSYGVQLVTGLTEGVVGAGIGPGGETLLADTFITPLPAISSVPGWSTTNTAGKYWTFGVEGFDIYLKYDGVEFWRSKQFYHLEPGKMALGCINASPYGFRDVTATHKISISGYSDSTTKTFDFRDFGMKSLRTTGTIGATSTSLVVADATGFSVGDRICIAVGGEAGGGEPGEQGVGGSWPTLKYATVAAMNADTTQLLNKCCGVLENGNSYQWNGSAWVPYYWNLNKYLQKILPKAHTAVITAIAGSTITIGTATVAATTDADVYFDNSALLTSSLTNAYSGIGQQTGCTFSIPPGMDWVFVNTNIAASSIPGFRLVGGGVGVTRIVYPKGTIGTSIAPSGCANALISDIEFLGNCRADNGYYFGFHPTLDYWISAIDSIRVTSCNGAIVERVKNTNYSVSAAVTAYCQDAVLRDIEVVHETGHKQYFQWAVAITDSNNCIIEDITYDCPNALKGLETFRSNDTILRRATGRNTFFSSNSSTGFLFEDCDIYYEEGCGDPGFQGVLAGSNPDPREPIVNLNSNIDNTSGSVTGSGGTIRNCNFDVRGRIWTGYGVNCIGITYPVNNILIEGRYPSKPVSEPSGLISLPNLGSDTTQAIRVDSNLANVVVDGIRVITASSMRPVGTLNGGAVPTLMTVRNSVIDNTPAGGTQTNNITNAEYEAL